MGPRRNRGLSADATDDLDGDGEAADDGLEGATVFGLDGDDDARLCFAEERGVESAAHVRGGGVEALVAGDAHLGERDGQSAVGAVVAGGGDALADGGEDGALNAFFESEVEGQAAADDAVLLAQVLASPERFEGLFDVRAEEEDLVAGVAKAHPAVLRDVFQDAQHADDRRRVDGAAAGLVVEADVAGDDGRAERTLQASAMPWMRLPCV